MVKIQINRILNYTKWNHALKYWDDLTIKSFTKKHIIFISLLKMAEAQVEVPPETQEEELKKGKKEKKDKKDKKEKKEKKKEEKRLKKEEKRKRKEQGLKSSSSSSDSSSSSSSDDDEVPAEGQPMTLEAEGEGPAAADPAAVPAVQPDAVPVPE